MSNFTMNRRGFLTNAALLGGLAAASQTMLTVSGANAQGLAKIRMQLGWLASNGLLGEVVAIEKGFYAEQDIELEIVPGGPNVDGVAGVASGQSNVGQISSSPSVMLARSAGVPIKAIAAGYQKHPYAYFSKKSKPIEKPADMVGKTVAIQPTGAILLRALLAKNGIAEDQVTVVNMGADMNQLVTGQADAVVGWLTNVNALKVLGDDRTDMLLWDTGIQLYANVYYTTDDQLANNTKDLTGFIAATAKGWGYARDNQAEAVDILVKAYPNLDKASELEAIGPLMTFAFNETTVANGWGAMSKENWEAQLKTYADLGQFKGTVPTVDDVMSLALLDATTDIRKKVG
ncbi:ABC transporter substrate-binding protein [Corticibacterium sp. UT-5YL-CI-8]|nr:ABC transporter substrate-binding protein [Tianweitania sp. UT-5YL-CI-8]